MTLCYGELNFFMKESTFIYCLTLFTFCVVGIFLFIQSTYSFFEKRKIPRGGLPSPPCGNIKDVIFKRTNFNIHLWKYYNRFKRKKYYFGGLYILSKPIVMFMDPYLVFCVLTDKKYFKDAFEDNENSANLGNISKIFKDRILMEFLKKYSSIEDYLFKNFNENSSSTEINSFLNEFYSKTTCILVGIQATDLTSDKPYYDSTFAYYFSLCYPKLSQLFNLRFDVKKLEGLKIKIQEELVRRKKNDIRKIDLINSMSNEEDTHSQVYTRQIASFAIDSLEFSQSLTQFCLYELCDNEEIQQELIGEIRRFRKDNDIFTQENITDLTLLNATIKETLRKYPPHATIIKRCCEDFKNEKYKLNLPKDCLAAVSVYGIHHDSANFPNPEQFDPDRFYIENQKYIKSYSFIPFGVGEESEIGIKYIVLQVKLCILSILSKYKVTLKHSSNLEFDSNKLTMSTNQPLIFNFELL